MIFELKNNSIILPFVYFIEFLHILELLNQKSTQ